MENNQNIKETILTYTSAWNETEREAILEKISRCWAPGGTYTDRLTDTITGPDAITELTISSYEQMGPRTFQVLAEPQVHHQSGRFRWLASARKDTRLRAWITLNSTARTASLAL